jgi:uncharacterized protein YjbI with pentapeptide repeats
VIVRRPVLRGGLLVLSLLVCQRLAAAVELRFVDTEAGMACLIKTESHTILIDGGLGVSARDYMRNEGMKGTPIDLAIVLYPSSDAYSGVGLLQTDGHAIREYWDPGWTAKSTRNPAGIYPNPTRGYQAFLDSLGVANVTMFRPLSAYHTPTAVSRHVEWFHSPHVPEVQFCLLYSRTSLSSRRFNQWPSLTLLIRVDGVRILVSGHTGNMRRDGSVARGVEARLVDLDHEMPGVLHADLLVAPYGGDLSASSPEFIAAVNPSIVVFSGSPFLRLPKRETIDRYLKSDRRIFNTMVHEELLRDNIVCATRAVLYDKDSDEKTKLSCSYVDARKPVSAKNVVRSVEEEETPGKAAGPADFKGQKVETRRLSTLDLSGDDFSYADLSDVDLSGKALTGARFDFARLAGAKLRNITTDAKTSFHGVQAREADFSGASLAKCDLSSAFLSGANLTGADLSGANLSDAEMTKTRLTGASLKEARIYGAAFDDAIWELRSGGTPPPEDVAWAPYLKKLRIERSPNALIELRDGFRKAGLREQERLLTFEIRRRERLHDEATGHWILSRLKLIAFEWPTLWGTSATRPLKIILVLWPLFAIIYFLFIRFSRDSGVRLLVTRRRRTEPTKNRMHVRRIRMRIVRRPRYVSRAAARTKLEIRTMLTALNYSFRNIVNLKFQWLDAGTWVRMLQRRDFELEGVGWVRSFAGVQSLLSLYLIAMAVLAYLGNPFG